MASFASVVDGGDDEEPWPSEEVEAQVLGELKELISTTVQVPTIGGKLIEPMSKERLSRFLGARKHRVKEAARLYAQYWNFRVSTFGARELSESREHDFLRLLGDDASDSKGRPRLLLDLAKLDLADDGLDTPSTISPLLERIWWVVDAALCRGVDAMRYGLILQVDARDAAPQRHLRPRRIQTIIDALVGVVPAKLAKIEVIGAPPWLSQSWLALGPLLKRKTASRATVYTVGEARGELGPNAVSEFDDDAFGTLERGVAMLDVSNEAPPSPDRDRDASPLKPVPARVPIQIPDRVSQERVDAIIIELAAGHVPVPPDVLDWTEDDAFMYFATDGEVKPKPPSGSPNPIANPPNRRASGCSSRLRMQREYFL